MCCNCTASFRARVENGGRWIQRSMKAPGAAEVWAYLCPSCAGHFSSEQGGSDFLDAALELKIATPP